MGYLDLPNSTTISGFHSSCIVLGSLFTSTEEFTGAAVATPDGRHVTWVSQENRQPFFGHLVLWGLQRPVMPW